MDSVTPLYQERLNYLTPQLRKIVSEMAFIWEACTTKQLVEKCRMQSKLISANLKTLVDKGLVDKIETSKKNHLYRLSERFFNMWLIITQGNPDQKRKAKWLSIFLENWYDADDFKNLADEHIHNLEDKNLDFKDALLFSKALSQCKYISTIERDKIIELTEDLNGNNRDFKILELPKKYKEIEEEVLRFIKNEEFDKALKVVHEIENEGDGVKFAFLSDIYHYNEDYRNCKKFLLLAIDKGQERCVYNLAFLLHINGKLKEAEGYYLRAIANGDIEALNNLGSLYEDLNRYEEAEKFYLKAIEANNIESLNNLSVYYYFRNVNKHKSLEYMQKYNHLNGEIKSRYFELIILTWNGLLDGLEKKLIDLIKEENNVQSQFINGLILQLLIHKQSHIILKLFLNVEFGKKLIDECYVLFFVTLILTNHDTGNLELKIPPEIKETVYEVIDEIKERQKFYGYE